MSTMHHKPSRHRLAALLVGILLLIAGIVLLMRGAWPGMRFGTVDEGVLVEIPPGGAAQDALVVTQNRLDYRRGEMVLVIPALDVSAPVGESTLPEVLERSPGLYEFSQMPHDGDVNVSIAGHRDIYGMEFYALDRLAEGDYLYLLYQNLVFRYRYLDTQVVPPDRWEVIRRQGFSCLTLTTCDPIGTTLRRLVVRAELDSVEQHGVENDLWPNRAAMQAAQEAP